MLSISCRPCLAGVKPPAVTQSHDGRFLGEGRLALASVKPAPRLRPHWQDTKIPLAGRHKVYPLRSQAMGQVSYNPGLL